MRGPPRLQEDGRNDDDHRGVVETNAGESKGAKDIEGANIDEADEIEER